jgi:hypothetical protein
MKEFLLQTLMQFLVAKLLFLKDTLNNVKIAKTVGAAFKAALN